MKLQPECKLVYILDSIDFSIVTKSFESESKKGPIGYNLESILRALLVQQIENIPNRAALVRRLKQDPVIRYVCGFHVAGRVPSEATMSRYYNKISNDDSLERLFFELVDQAIDEDIIGTDTLAIDSTKIESYERAKPRK